MKTLRLFICLDEGVDVYMESLFGRWSLNSESYLAFVCLRRPKDAINYAPKTILLIGSCIVRGRIYSG